VLKGVKENPPFFEIGEHKNREEISPRKKDMGIHEGKNGKQIGNRCLN